MITIRAVHMRLLVIFSSFAVLAVFGFHIAVAPFVIENDHRLAPTFAILRGYSLYYGQTDGPILTTIYGPIAPLAYLPAALARTPVFATRIATILSLLFFYVPALVLLGNLEPRVPSRPLIHWVRCLTLITALVSLVEPLSKSSSLVHADAPALGASALSCFFALRSRSKVAPQDDTLCALCRMQRSGQAEHATAAAGLGPLVANNLWLEALYPVHDGRFHMVWTGCDCHREFSRWLRGSSPELDSNTHSPALPEGAAVPNS
jgi:hypothetical protein